MALTDAKIKAAGAKAKTYRLTDGDGMYLEISPSGSKYWRLKYRINRKEKRLALGVYPAVTLKSAREKRDEARQLVAAGVDPSAMRRRDKRAAQAASENSFEVVAKEWVSKQGKWSPGHVDRVLSSFTRDVFPKIGRQPIATITPTELLEGVLRPVERRGALDVASRVLQRCSSVFRYAIQTGRLEGHNPATELRGALETRTVTHRAALSADQLPEFLERLRGYDGMQQTQFALHLLLLTFVRPGELRGAQWAEINLECKHPEWRIPAERMKGKRLHIVPLSRPAVRVLEVLRPISGHRVHLFPGERDRAAPMSANTLIYAMYRLGYHGRATAHGFRTLASTALNESGRFESDWIERQLAHTEKNAVRGAYNAAEYLTQRRRMMQWWGGYVERAGSRLAARHSAANSA